MLKNSRLPLVASFSLSLAACASSGDNSPNAQTGASGPGGTAGAAASPASGAGGTATMEPGVAGTGTGAGGTGGAAQPISGGTGGAAGSMGPGVGGSAGAAVNPELEALLLEGVGDIVRPPPYEYGPYSQERDDVPHGTVKEFTYNDDTFFPDAPPRGVKVFEPAQYEAGKVARSRGTAVPRSAPAAMAC